MDNAHSGAGCEDPGAQFVSGEQGVGENPGTPSASLPKAVDAFSGVQDRIGRRHAKLSPELAGLPGMLAGVDHAMFRSTPSKLGENGHQLDQFSLSSVCNMDHAMLSKENQPLRLLPDRGMVLHRSKDCKRSAAAFAEGSSYEKMNFGQPVFGSLRRNAEGEALAMDLKLATNRPVVRNPTRFAISAIGRSVRVSSSFARLICSLRISSRGERPRQVVNLRSSDLLQMGTCRTTS